MVKKEQDRGIKAKIISILPSFIAEDNKNQIKQTLEDLGYDKDDWVCAIALLTLGNYFDVDLDPKIIGSYTSINAKL